MHKNNFYFVRTSDNQFIWTDHQNYKFVWENPKIQTFDYYMLLNSEKDILYYYYNFKIYQFYGGDWKKIAATYATDFPCVQLLSRAIYDFMKTDITDYAEYNKKTRIYHEMLDNWSPLGEDFFKLERYFHTELLQEWYAICLGAGKKSIAIPNINFNDLLELQDCVDSFIAYSCELHNKEKIQAREFNKKKYICKNHKLYVQELDKQGNPTGHYEQAICIGDKFSSFYAFPDDTYQKNCLEYPDAILLQAEYNNIILDTYQGKKNISVQNIQYISNDFNDKVTWNISQMAQEFHKSLSKPELLDFQEKAVKSLVEIYADMIIDRYAIYRSEHELIGSYEFSHEEREKMALSAVAKIISEIKQNLI